MPTEIFIGEAPKRSRAVPPNQSALSRRAARTAAVKREASAPAEDRRVRARGGPANAERAALRQNLAANPRLYQDKQGNVKARVAKTVGAKAKKSSSFSEAEVSARPEDRYGVRRRVSARSKSLGASASRSRERAAALVA